MSKRLIALVVALVIVLTSGLTAFAWEEGCSAERTYTAYKNTVTVDGVIEEAWNCVPWTPIEIPINQPYPSDNIEYYGAFEQVKIMYDDNYFYYLLDIRGADPFTEDVFEVYIEEGEPLEDGYTNGYQISMVYDYEADDLSFSLTLKYTDEYDTFVKEYDMEDEVEHKLAWKASDDDKSIIIELAVKKLATTSVDGATVAMEFMYEDFGKIGDIEAVLEDYRWNVIEMDSDENPTGVTRPNNASGNFGLVTLGGEAPVQDETTDQTTGDPVTDNNQGTNDNNADDKKPGLPLFAYVGIGIGVVAVVAVVIVLVAKKK